MDRFIRGVKRKKGETVEAKEALNPEILLQVYSVIDRSAEEDWLLWALLVVGFFSFFRPSNLIPDGRDNFDPEKALSWGRVEFSDQGVSIKYRWSKVIQYRERWGVVVLAPVPNSPLCPVTMLRTLKECYKGGETDPVFAARDKNQRWWILTQYRATVRFRQLLSKVGWRATSFSLRSLRIGGASWAFKCGVPVELIKIQGDWKSDTYQRYLRIDTESRAQTATTMASAIGQTGAQK